MRQSDPMSWPSNRVIVDRRSGLTTILMMLVSVQGVVVAATLANHHWTWVLVECLLFLLPDAWLARKAYGLGIGLRQQELDQRSRAWSPAQRDAARRQLEQLQAHTDRDWLTRAEVWALRQ